jgi:hypothetical protein
LNYPQKYGGVVADFTMLHGESDVVRYELDNIDALGKSLTGALLYLEWE